MLNIMNTKKTPQDILKELGNRLRTSRLARNESQELFASRLGISRQSYSKMEQGLPSTSIGHWLEACHILGKLESWHSVLAEDKNLFDQFEERSVKRKRAGSRGRGTK
jgi:transcriptional regulator with XRE-family HTH domain